MMNKQQQQRETNNNNNIEKTTIKAVDLTNAKILEKQHQNH